VYKRLALALPHKDRQDVPRLIPSQYYHILLYSKSRTEIPFREPTYVRHSCSPACASSELQSVQMPNGRCPSTVTFPRPPASSLSLLSPLLSLCFPPSDKKSRNVFLVSYRTFAFSAGIKLLATLIFLVYVTITFWNYKNALISLMVGK